MQKYMFGQYFSSVFGRKKVGYMFMVCNWGNAYYLNCNSEGKPAGTELELLSGNQWV